MMHTIFQNRLLSNPKIWFFAAIWASIWFSINAESRQLDGSLLSLIHSVRFFLPYAAAFIAVVWICWLGHRPKLQLWHIGIFGYAGTVAISGVINEVPLSSIHFHLVMLCALAVAVLGDSLCKADANINQNEMAYVLMGTGLLILTAVILVFFLHDLLQAIKTLNLNGYALQALAPQQFGMETPRPTGTARSAVFLGITCLGILLLGSSRPKTLRWLASFFLGLTLFYQARGSFVAFALTGVFMWLLIPQKKRPGMASVVGIALRSVFVFGLILAIIHAAHHFAVFLASLGLFDFGNNASSNSSPFRDFTPELIGNGRLIHWHNGIMAFMDSPFIGLGSQADRTYVGQNVSSMPVYLLMCGGLLGALFACLAIWRPVRRLYKLITDSDSRAEPSNHTMLFLVIPLFFFLTVRGIFENSYALFNIDFMLAAPLIWLMNTPEANTPEK